jgi:cellulose biosynthesis protein BcsQ
MAEIPTARRLTFFNHKGGVGKTTLTVNTASALARLGKRVLLVDSDPQCNLTSYLIESEVVDDLLDNSDRPEGQTIWSAVKPVAEASGDITSITPIELPIGNLFLVPGDIRLSEFEAELNDYWTQCWQRKHRGFRGIAALSRVITEICENLNIDFVFYDAGPNIGALNRCILLDCDYFIVAVACDLFSVRALKTLGRTLASWIDEWRTISQLAPSGTELLRGHPEFLGYVPQRIRVYRGQPSSQHSKYLSRIERHMQSDVIKVLKTVDETLAHKVRGSRLGSIKDFGVMVAASQMEGIPLADVTEGAPYQREQAGKAFRGIAEQILERSA